MTIFLSNCHYWVGIFCQKGKRIALALNIKFHSFKQFHQAQALHLLYKYGLSL